MHELGVRHDCEGVCVTVSVNLTSDLSLILLTLLNILCWSESAFDFSVRSCTLHWWILLRSSDGGLFLSSEHTICDEASLQVSENILNGCSVLTRGLFVSTDFL